AGLVERRGRGAAEVLPRHAPDTAAMAFMTARSTRFDGIECHVSRSGYTGEDGYEISVKAIRVRAIVERLLGHAEVKLVGLGARDSLRLEAGVFLFWAHHRAGPPPGPGGGAPAGRAPPARRGGRSRAGWIPGCVADSARARARTRPKARRLRDGRPHSGTRGRGDPS